jgi:glycosyltransferase involved in cell wall biosynthesis
MTNPLISICIPTYNGEKYLAECIDTCLDQTFTDYEIVVCDDGSNDGTIAMLEEYQRKHSFIKFHKNEKNLGLVGNWNKCIELSSGKWIKFVFQDDFITSNCLQEFVNAINENTVLIVSKRNFALPERSTPDEINYYSNDVRTLENTNKNKSNFFNQKLVSKIGVENICLNFIGEPSLIFFKKNVVEDVGLFNSALKQICDLEFALRVASKYGLKYIPKKLCALRVHKDSTTSTNVSDKYYELHNIEPLLYSYFLLYSKNFEAFRSNLNYLQLIKLNLYFRVKAYKAYLINVKEDLNYYLFNDSNTQYKEITKCKKGNLFIKLIVALF